MACAKPSVVSAPILLVVVLVMAAEPGIALKLEPSGTSSHIPPLLDCAPADAAAPSNNLSAFRTNLLALLGALPTAAEAADTAFATSPRFAAAQPAVSFSVAGDLAFARALCFGSGGDCRQCVSAAARDLAGGCPGRRGGAWREHCFVSYADTDATTSRGDAFRGWFYDNSTDGDGLAWAGLCAGTDNSTAAECSRCLDDSAQVVPALKEGRQLSLVHVHGDAVVVVGYACLLRVPLFDTTTTRWWLSSYGWLSYAGAVVVVIEICGVLSCICIARGPPV